MNYHALQAGKLAMHIDQIKKKNLYFVVLPDTVLEGELKVGT